MIPKQVSFLLFIIIPLIICNLLYIDLCKSSTKNDISPKPKKYSSKKLKENNDNNFKFNNSIIDNHNNMKCINVKIIDSDDNENKISVESLGDKEYELCLKNALKEALDENEKVRKIKLYIFLIFIYR